VNGGLRFANPPYALAWRHFDLHARQRTTMFHFFILLTPFFSADAFSYSRNAKR
jgi:hypothetical protein